MNARTSQSHPLQIDTLGPVGRGRLGLTFCPGKVDPMRRPVPGTGIWTPIFVRCAIGARPRS
jgi:hypothetical protein